MSTYSNRLQPDLQNLLQRVVRFFHPRSSCTTMHIWWTGRAENNIKCVVHDDLWWKNQTTRYILPRHWLYEWFSQFHRCGTYSVLSRSPSITKSVAVGCYSPTHCPWLLANVTATLSPPIGRMNSVICDERGGVCVGGRGTGRHACGCDFLQYPLVCLPPRRPPHGGGSRGLV